jgi:GNAT superfamily N-acetyltransferase
VKIRPGGPDDLATVLAIVDDAVDWLVLRGSGGQWGTEPWSERQNNVERIEKMASDGGMWIAEIDGVPTGMLHTSESSPTYAPPVDRRELYVHFLVASRDYAGRGVGRTLLDFARDQARQRGIELVRVDCWAGGDGALVRYYVDAGFTRTTEYNLGDWQGQIFEQHLSA